MAVPEVGCGYQCGIRGDCAADYVIDRGEEPFGPKADFGSAFVADTLVSSRERGVLLIAVRVDNAEPSATEIAEPDLYHTMRHRTLLAGC